MKILERAGEQPFVSPQEAARIGALEAAQIGDWELDLATNIMRRSALHDRCFGYRSSPAIWGYQEFIDHLHPDDRDAVEASYATGKALVTQMEIECRVIWPDKSVHWIWWKGRFYPDEQGHSVRVAGIVGEITARKLHEDQIALYSLITQKITTPVILTDLLGKITWVNAPFETLSGYALVEVLGRKPGDVLQGPETDKNTIRLMHEALAKAQGFAVEVLNYRKDGQIYWQHLKVDPVLDHQGVITGFLALQTDVTERKRFEALLWRNANYDTLTELPNRRLFWDRLEQEVRHAQRTGKLVALFYLDIDRFKEINDLFGHEIGDQLLIEVAKRINACVRGSDTVARLGGDEFTIILPQLEALNDGERIAQKILASLTQPFYFDQLRVEVSASIGIALYPNDSPTTQQLVNNADQAMYMAKTHGRNQFCYFTPSMQIRAQERLHMGVDLRQALKPDQLRVFFQPIICMASGKIVKAEALLRWQHPVQGLIEPAIFIPLAEELGLIGDIGEWVFREAATWAAEFSRQGQPNFQVSVNMSPLQFVRQMGERSWPRQLQDMGLPCKRISVEITESALLQDSRLVIDTLREYRDAGMEIALDDFGTGYSSMSYLVKFGIDYLKIDQSFVRNMAQKNSRTIAETIIVMGHKLGLKVIAEGVETAEQMHILMQAGCDYVQGYLFSAALPPEEFGRMLVADRCAG